MATRSRITATLNWRSRSNGFQPWTDRVLNVLSTDEMLSTNHYPLDTEIDDGGEWLLRKTWDFMYPGTYKSGLFEGEFCCSPPTSWTPTAVTEISVNEMNSRGTTAIARSAPTNPNVNLATSLAEMRGKGVGVAIPGYRSWRDRTLTAKNAGSEYLNVEFGWKPLVSDIMESMRSVKDASALISAFQKGSGKKTRVGYHFPSEELNRSGTAGNFFPTDSAVGFGTGTIFEQWHEKTWFSGAFKYYVPMGSSTSDRIKRYEQYANHLFGTRITPEVLWNAAPWSWFGDWFGTTGDVLHNISVLGHDGLVMQYGYVMNERERETTMVATFTAQRIPVSRRLLYSWKKRTKATPYGFGVDMSALSSKQVAILVALGLSQGVPGRG